jgi:hypothetical protein
LLRATTTFCFKKCKFAETLVAKSDAFLFYKMRTIIEVPFAAIFAILAAVLMGDKRRASIVYNGNNYTLLRPPLHAALSPQRTDSLLAQLVLLALPRVSLVS